MTVITRRTATTLFVAAALSSAAGCATLNNTERGAILGASGGAAIGAVLGNHTGNSAAGAIIGAAMGGAAGAAIGREMDQQAKSLEYQLEGAHIERIGEGIRITFDSGILFGYNSSDLQGTALQNLDRLAESLLENPHYDVLVVGHTDSKGSDEYNLRLSERRAESAAAHLASRGVEPRRVLRKGVGEMEPVDTNDTDFGRANNRRVEVAIFAGKEYRERIKSHGGWE